MKKMAVNTSDSLMAMGWLLVSMMGINTIIRQIMPPADPTAQPLPDMRASSSGSAISGRKAL